MSGKLMGGVYEVELTHGQQAVLLAMADHGQDDGSNVFPSVGLIEWKTGYDRRNVQRKMRELEEIGVLIKVADATRRLPAEYQIDLDVAVTKPAFEPKGQGAIRGGNSDTRGGKTNTQGRHPARSGAVNGPHEPSVEPSEETDVEGIFNFWVTTLDKRQHKLTAKRRKKVRARLAEDFTPREICEAIKGLTFSPHHMGTLPDSTRPYDDLELICREPEKVEGFRDLYQAKSQAKAERIDTNAEADRIRREQGLEP